MIYTARGESQVANNYSTEAKRSAIFECYICHETLYKSCILSYKRSGSVYSYFTLNKDVLKEDIPLRFNTFK